MNFHVEKHPRTQVPLMSADDDLLVMLDEHQTQLQTLLSSKFISHFVDHVMTWKSQMSTADMVLQLLTEVQRTWSNLEAIFIATDDIRVQLPQETAAFDRIDQEFRVIVSSDNLVDPSAFDSVLRKQMLPISTSSGVPIALDCTINWRR